MRGEVEDVKAMLIPTSASSQAGEKWNPKELCKKLESLWLKKKKIKKKKQSKRFQLWVWWSFGELKFLKAAHHFAVELQDLLF